MALVPGTMVTDKVRLKRPLDEGAMGTLWVADHLGFNAEVVVKFILPELQKSNPQALARFNVEAQVLGRIKSPHVVQIFDRSEMPDGTPFIVMELLDGETLVQRLERTGALSLELCAKIVRQLAEALSAVHQQGVVHRDMKAENIFLTGPPDNPFVKLLDFGVAKLPQAPQSQKLTAPGMMVGTPEYMCPTQTVAAMAVDHKSDCWALAVVAYLSLALGFPFTGPKTSDTFQAIRTGQYRPLSQVRPDLGTWFDAWFAKAFTVDPKQRFENAAQMTQAFDQVVLGRQLAAAGVPQGVKTLDTHPGGGSNKALIIGLMVMGLVIVALLVVLLLRR
jgi:eukaryotic-like serine/threonine-protein kinase